MQRELIRKYRDKHFRGWRGGPWGRQGSPPGGLPGPPRGDGRDRGPGPPPGPLPPGLASPK